MSIVHLRRAAPISWQLGIDARPGAEKVKTPAWNTEPAADRSCQRPAVAGQSAVTPAEQTVQVAVNEHHSGNYSPAST
ncbi:hypothetical protein M513_12749 [Trichuris suis]|uniref:Uncharacterized protein n=1 Tax=Trichuris suis TaxID=68888 RepID=A0A085LN32_9BILA|nr:hypothetical protein M513_12749 [Trichuris suis]